MLVHPKHLSWTFFHSLLKFQSLSMCLTCRIYWHFLGQVYAKCHLIKLYVIIISSAEHKIIMTWKLVTRFSVQISFYIFEPMYFTWQWYRRKPKKLKSLRKREGMHVYSYRYTQGMLTVSIHWNRCLNPVISFTAENAFLNDPLSESPPQHETIAQKTCSLNQA